MISSKKILILTYQIPPYGGIGGRRWAKFGIELLNRGYDVHFLASEPDKSQAQKWEDDFEKIDDRIEYFKSNYPKALKNKASSLGEKMAYRFQLGKLKNKEKGNYFDHSCCDETIIRNKINQKINEGFKTIISSGAPFTQLYFIARIKNERKDFRFIADLRDPWTFQDWSYGFQTINDTRKKIEKERERFLIKQADQVLTVANKMSDDFRNLTSKPEKIQTLCNGYDPKEYKTQKELKKENNLISFVFTGNYYDSALAHIQYLVDSLSKLKESDFELYDSLIFNFYGTVPNQFLETISSEEKIVFHGSIPSSQVSEKINESDVSMLFLIDGLNYSLSTKFFEYIALSKPILLFAKSGETSKFITSKKIGWHFQNEQFQDKIKEIKKLKDNNELTYNSNFEREQFSIPVLSNKLEEILKD